MQPISLIKAKSYSFLALLFLSLFCWGKNWAWGQDGGCSPLICHFCSGTSTIDYACGWCPTSKNFTPGEVVNLMNVQKGETYGIKLDPNIPCNPKFNQPFYLIIHRGYPDGPVVAYGDLPFSWVAPDNGKYFINVYRHHNGDKCNASGGSGCTYLFGPCDTDCPDPWEDPLPIKLTYFKGKNIKSNNVLKWRTETEEANALFIIEHSVDGQNWKEVDNQLGEGNSTIPHLYVSNQRDYEPIFNYYRLSQVSYNGEINILGVISIDNRGAKQRIKESVNILGQKVDKNYSGIVIQRYENNTVEKIMK